MNIAKKTLVGLCRVYQKFSPAMPAKCRYVPTCSAFFIEAVEKFGAVKGTCLGIGRILRCNHFAKGGYDPVPENISGDYKWLL